MQAVRKRAIIVAVALAAALVSPGFGLAQGASADRARLDKIQQSLKADVPRILCLTESYATGAQPLDEAFGKLAANGFHSVLNLRTAEEGVDLARKKDHIGTARRFEEWLVQIAEKEGDIQTVRKFLKKFFLDRHDRKSTRLNSSHSDRSRMPSSA